ncbi:MAG: Hpt domain-containing protein, partial [Planctomycetota bacterium]
MFRSMYNYLLLPNAVSEFEDNYLRRMNLIAMRFFVLHLPVFCTIAYFNNTDAVLAAALTSAVLIGPLLAIKVFRSRRDVSVVHGIAAMFMGGLLVHFGQGPVQIEMHFYFFVLIALLAVFANPIVIVAAALTAAAHHAVLWAMLPNSVFNYDAPLWVVAVHAAFVVLESIAACFISRSFFDNVIELEKKIQARTAEVEARNRDMHRVLDSVEQGLLTLDFAGKMSEERSAAVDELLSPKEGEESFIEAVRQHDSNSADWLELGLAEVEADILPIEATIGQLPDQIEAGDRSLSFKYSPVYDEAQAVTGVAVVITDITAQIKREMLEADTREMVKLLDCIHRDKNGFLEFIQEAETIMKELESGDLSDLVLIKRRVHTLKGNAATFGLQRTSDACHQIEDHIAQQDENAGDEYWDHLFACWQKVRTNLQRLVQDEDEDAVRLSDEEYRQVLGRILEGASRETLALQVAGWKLEPTAGRLQRIAEQTKQVARRLQKAAPRIVVRDNELKTEPESWRPFWSDIFHVVRNAVDHGIEDSDERERHGKSPDWRIE